MVKSKVKKEEEDRKIFEFGYILIDNLNTTTDINKTKLLSASGTYNKKLNEQKEDRIKKTNEYKNKYETPRKNNIDNYDKYLRNKDILYKKWKNTNHIKDLYELISIKTPEYIDVPDIYTIHPIL